MSASSRVTPLRVATAARAWAAAQAESKRVREARDSISGDCYWRDLNDEQRWKYEAANATYRSAQRAALRMKRELLDLLAAWDGKT